jgi:hypothetical protein
MFITAHRVNYCVELDHGMNPRLYPFVFLWLILAPQTKPPIYFSLKSIRKLSFRFYIVFKPGVRRSRVVLSLCMEEHHDEQSHCC